MMEKKSTYPDNNYILKPHLKPHSIFLIAALISSGAVVSAFLEVGDSRGFEIFEVALPRIILLILLLAITQYYAIPKLLLKEDYGKYAFLTGMLCVMCTLVSICLENRIKIVFGAHLEAIDFYSVYIWAYVISNSTLLFILVGGISGLAIYNKWEKQYKIEKAISIAYQENINILKSRFDTSRLMLFLDEIIAELRIKGEHVQDKIAALSEHLRHQLYDLPPIIAITETKIHPSDSLITSLLISPRLRLFRWICMETLIALISLGAFFPCFQLSFTFTNLIGFATPFVILNLAVCMNYFIVFPYFIKHQSLTKYLIAISIPVIIIGIIAFVANFISYSEICRPSLLVSSIALISSFGTTVALELFWVGTSGFLSLQHWMRTDRKIILLAKENREVEYSILKKQLNPHFLFNVLNNIDFLYEENPKGALDMVNKFKEMLNYQLIESQKQYTTVGDEIEFLKSYLTLEGMRHDVFEYEIYCNVDTQIRIPTLLLIPIVENAVKHSAVVDNRRVIHITVSLEVEQLLFHCSNTYHPKVRKENGYGGIGLSNIQMRLDLLFDGRYSFTQHKESGYFVTTLKIPIPNKV